MLAQATSPVDNEISLGHHLVNCYVPIGKCSLHIDDAAQKFGPRLAKAGASRMIHVVSGQDFVGDVEVALVDDHLQVSPHYSFIALDGHAAAHFLHSERMTRPSPRSSIDSWVLLTSKPSNAWPARPKILE